MKLPSGRGRSHDGRPSFLIVRADELSAARLGCYGDRYALTPHIDALAADGVRFTRALSAEPVCAAYRASFNLGLYTHATTNGNFLDPADVTIHDRLHAAGYRTAHVGKWHQTPPSLQVSFLPHFVPAAILDGLDYHGGHEQTHELVGPEAIYFENGVYVPLSAEPWRPQKHVDLALAQVDVAVAEGRPFYVVVDLEPPHFPYQDIRGTVWDVFEPGDVPCNPNVPPEDVHGLRGGPRRLLLDGALPGRHGRAARRAPRPPGAARLHRGRLHQRPRLAPGGAWPDRGQRAEAHALPGVDRGAPDRPAAERPARRGRPAPASCRSTTPR